MSTNRVASNASSLPRSSLEDGSRGLRRWLRHDRPDLLRIVRLLRYELEILGVRLRARLSWRQAALRRKVRAGRDLKVHLASGPHPRAGWINVDTCPQADLLADLRRRMPFASGSVAYVFAEHFVDHLHFPDAVGGVLRECHRILKPGGMMRVVVHDGELLLRKYLERDVAFLRQLGFCELSAGPEATPIEIVNEVFRFNMSHQFIYDYETLEAAFRRAGFRAVSRSSYGGSAIPELNLDSALPDRTLQSLYVEAVK